MLKHWKINSVLVLAISFLAFIIPLSQVAAQPSGTPNTINVIGDDSSETPGEVTFIVGEEAIRKELERMELDLDKLMQDPPEKGDGASPDGAGGHAGVMFCRGPATAYNLYHVSPGGYVGAFSGTSLWIGGDVCNNALGCLVLGNAFIPVDELALSYYVIAPLTIDYGAWCS